MKDTGRDGSSVEEIDFIPIAIIGAGFSGIAAGCRIKEKLGFSQFKIFERMDGVGGVWRKQRYPGVACDIPAPLYSLSFAQSTGWSTLTPSGEEIQCYLDGVCKKYEMINNIQFNTEITDLNWEESSSRWKISGFRLQREKERELFSLYANVVIIAAGKFYSPNLANIPKLPGIDRFGGRIIHTLDWDDSLNLEGKDVIVVGSGCTAAQVVPSLLASPHNAGSVTQLMRSAPWVRPKFISERLMSMWEQYMPWLTRHIPFLAGITRMIIFVITESYYYLLFASSIGRTRFKRHVLRYIHREAPAEYHEILAPDCEVGCKRFVQDIAWYESLNDPRVHLTTANLKVFEENAVVLEDRHCGLEKRIPAQIVVLATGYDISTFYPSMSTTGRDGVELHRLWTERGGPQTYLGIAVDKFPNLFILGGPNSTNGHTSVLINIENGVGYLIQLLKPIIMGDISTCEVKTDACTRWTSKIQDASNGSVWKTGCSNWYISKTGWNGTAYP
ncbi:flavin-binding monooxygenase [Talaromyces proteolyticus]|uniref:Flavin-binding monooxygenase n=1 Tax=Talaromyces proteolyticus TaxID=1131652 RepID=A0AAD4L0P2_9EURO|nr:flavin-binding monooxygenase [Talaromyces proteolyticus]KAH8704084.1 flavin-binding monooxygenase [Talaromyces proteolyticus]